MQLIERRVPGRDGKGGESPGPPPSGSASSRASKQQHVKNEILRKVGRLAYQVVKRRKLLGGQRWKDPMKEGEENTAGVFGRELVRGQEKNEGGPQQCGPPGPEESGQVGFRGHAPAHFTELRRRSRVSPRLFRQARSPVCATPFYSSELRG